MSHPAQLKPKDVLDVIDPKSGSRIGIAQVYYTGEHNGTFLKVNLYSIPLNGTMIIRHPTDQTKVNP